MIRFDTAVGTGQQVNFGNFLTPAGLSSFTICAFIQYDLDADGGFGRVFGHDNGGIDIAFSLTTRDSLVDGTKRILQFVIQTGAGNDLTVLEETDVQLSPDKLYHVAGVYDGSQMRMYIDALEVASVAKTGNVSVENGWPLVMGNRPDGQRSFEGLIGDCRVYNRVLTPDDLLAIKETLGEDGIDNGLLFRAPLDGPNGVTITGANTVLNELSSEFTTQRGGTAQGNLTYEDMPIPVDETPLSMNDVFAWFDASDESTMLFTDNNSVNGWKDKLGDPTKVMSSGSDPEIDEVVINGRSTLNFDSLERFSMPFLDGAAGLVGKRYAIFIVESKDNTDRAQWIFGGSDANTNSNLHIGYRTSDTFSFAQWDNDINRTLDAYNAAGVTRLHTMINNTTGRVLRLNGAQVGSSTNTQTLLDYNNPELGFLDAFGDPEYAGAICEIIIFDRLMTDKEITQLEAYLIKKWGI
jgi:hypothetical protein